MSVRLENKAVDLTDRLRDINKRLNDLEASDRLESDTFTRLQLATGSAQVVGSKWLVYENPINDSFIVGHPINGVLGVVNPNTTGSIISGGGWVDGVGIGYNKAISLGSPSVVLQTNASNFEVGSSNFTIGLWTKTS